METIVTYPVLTLVLSLLVLWLAAHLGAKIRLPDRGAKPEDRDDFNLVLSATLTLLGLIIGFTFSMAISRYDQRKVYEEAEANAIGTEYVRADLLPASNGTQARTLLSKYIAQRILFYTTRDETQIQRINADTARLQNQLWSTVEAPALAQPTPVMALAVAGMNDVLNSQGYTQAAWWNRIPGSAWGLMLAIAIFANLLLGYRMRGSQAKGVFFLVLPLIVSISFFLVADIDSPRRGLIRVVPQNLVSLTQSLHP